NSEVMGILMDLERFGDGTITTNGTNHIRNPQRTTFLQPKVVSDTNSPGVGLDGVFRDPWGNPYIISFDLDNDGTTVDGYYGKLIDKYDSNHANSKDKPEPDRPDRYIESKVLIWSMGPDGKVEPLPAADDFATGVAKGIKQGANKDNIL